MPKAWPSGISIAMVDSEEVWKPHVTVAAIIEKEQRFLLVRERVDGREVLNQPAGHLDPNETLEQAVIRETLEETSYPFQPRQLTGIYRYVPDPSNQQQSYLRFAFSGEVGECLHQPLDRDIIRAEWMTLDEVKQSQDIHRSPMTLECILDYLQKPAYPLHIFSPSFL